MIQSFLSKLPRNLGSNPKEKSKSSYQFYQGSLSCARVKVTLRNLSKQ